LLDCWLRKRLEANMSSPSQARGRHERTVAFRQVEKARVDVKTRIIRLPEVLAAYMTVHEQLRYPRCLRVGSDTKALQGKLDELLRNPAAPRLPLDPERALEAKRAEVRSALAQLKIGACLYAPFIAYPTAYVARDPSDGRAANAGGDRDTVRAWERRKAA
jgi:hypothetical protein